MLIYSVGSIFYHNVPYVILYEPVVYVKHVSPHN